MEGLFPQEGEPPAGPHPMHVIGREIEERGAEWPLLKAGFLDGSLERLQEVQREYRLVIRRMALTNANPAHWPRTVVWAGIG